MELTESSKIGGTTNLPHSSFGLIWVLEVNGWVRLTVPLPLLDSQFFWKLPSGNSSSADSKILIQINIQAAEDKQYYPELHLTQCLYTH